MIQLAREFPRGMLAAVCLLCGALAASVSPLAQGPVQVSQTGEDESQSQWDVIHYGPAKPGAGDPWQPLKTDRLVGRIIELNAERLELVTPAGDRRRLTSDRVEAVEVAWENAAAEQAHARYLKRQYREALRENVAVIRSGLPTWQQRILIGELIESAEALGSVKIAGSLFLDLAKESPPAWIVAAMPLNWTTRETDEAVAKSAREWLEQPDDYAGLLGASWLLLTPEGAAAETRLKKLTQSDRPLVAQFARAQLWRIAPPPETASFLTQWLEFRDGMLRPAQLGPTEFLAERLARTGQANLAVGQWMRIATKHGDRYHRAKLALEAARRQLVQLGQAEQAEKVAAWILDAETAPGQSP
jgi:hypothetical protein